MKSATPVNDSKGSFLGWRMAGIGFFSQNLSISATFGVYSLFFIPLMNEFSASRSVISSGIAILTLIMGLMSPLVGGLLDRFSIRKIMLIGATLLGVGFITASQSQSVYVFLAVYALLIAPGLTMAGPLSVATLTSNWFDHKRGLVIGLVNVPLFNVCMPILVAMLIIQYGWRVTFICIGMLFLLLIPLLTRIVSRPSDVNQLPYGASPENHDTAATSTISTYLTKKDLIRIPSYWLHIIAFGLITSGGIVFITHIIPFSTDYGISESQASLLLSINGISGMVGAILFGWLADKFKPNYSLALAAFIQVILWASLTLRPPFELLSLIVLGIGLSGGGALPAFYSLIASKFGTPSFGTAIGLASILVLPLNFGSPILSGFLFDQTGSYDISFKIHILFFVISFLYLASSNAKPHEAVTLK
ncbi:MFS transporter [Zhongshania aquimaris]|uniref:MFS transporter n=1 Tax=Zhongshania aquimaris TaxID=2857107 RepID=A0ABS6VV52_9GAMM|nr:MFS transporter [Zhongshania aquimaris]MBW2942214.1 MFS transporter [Zhongshania aquimaris]